MFKFGARRFWQAMIILPLAVFGLVGTQVCADDKLTQQHQILHQIDYTPLHFGLLAGSGQPLIHVTINDTQTATFLFDTGTSYSVISTELAKKMNLPLKPGIGSADGLPILWKGKQTMMTSVPMLSIGTLRIKDMSLVVLDSQAISLSPTGRDTSPYSGILGISLLQQFAILLDGQKHTFGICLPGGLSQQQLSQIGMTQPYVLPLTNLNNFQWYVQAQFANGGLKGNENLLLDTGSSDVCISERLAQEIKIKAVGQQGIRSAYGFDTAATAVIGELCLGDLTLSNFPLTVRSVSKEKPPVLGMNILSGYRVLMDFPAKKMYLQPNMPPVSVTTKPAPPSLTPTAPASPR